jgi:DNA-binding MarR family transcriptional regulator
VKSVQPVKTAADKARSTKSTAPSKSRKQKAAARVLRRFRIVFNAVKSHFRDIERRTGVGGAQLWALSIIAETPGVGVGALAVAMDIRQSTASNLVKSLIAQGYVEPRKGEQDEQPC